MSRQKKKRMKKYSGLGAKTTTPNIVRVTAEERSAFREWWLTYGRLVRFGGIAAGIVAVIALCVAGLIGLLL